MWRNYGILPFFPHNTDIYTILLYIETKNILSLQSKFHAIAFNKQNYKKDEKENEITLHDPFGCSNPDFMPLGGA